MNPYEDLTAETVLARDIPWETYMTAKLITDKDLQIIRRFDKSSGTMQGSMMERQAPACFTAFLNVLHNVTFPETVQYVVALLDTMIAAYPETAAMMHAPSDMHLTTAPDPYSILIRLLSRNDWFTQEHACRLMSIAIQHHPDQHALAHVADGLEPTADEPAGPSASNAHLQQALVQFIDWLCSQMRRPTHSTRSPAAAVTALSRLLRIRSVRVLFVRSGGLPLLVTLLKDTVNAGCKSTQLLYESTLCLWQCSYLADAAAMLAGSGAQAVLVEEVKHAQKEKVLRVACLVLKNLLETQGLDLGGELVELGLRKALQVRLLQTWGDEDIQPLMEELDEKLAEGLTVVTTFEKYKKEVLSGSLDWSSVHTQASFWSQNADKFEERDYEVLRCLLKLLHHSREGRTLAVGCSDLGMFVSHHPQGRYIAGQLKAKELVMRHLTHPDPDVQKQALLTVQKMMLTKDKLDFMQTLMPVTA